MSTTTERSCLTLASVGGEVVDEHPPVVVRMDQLAAVGGEVPDDPATVPFQLRITISYRNSTESATARQTDRCGDRRHRERLGRTCTLAMNQEARARADETMTPVTA